MNLPERMVPPSTKEHVSVVALRDYWYVACRSEELKDRPLSRTVLGVPVVLFRSEGRATTLLDRCPHRNVPLSAGRVTEAGTLECSYHGWQFGVDGSCQRVPGLLDSHRQPSRCATAYPTLERDGLVWVYPSSQEPGDQVPFELPLTHRSGYATVIKEVETPATLHATLENALDVPHTAFLHKGLFRGGQKNRIQAHVHRQADRIEIQYEGEPRPTGIAARLLSPSGGTVEHWDRFFLPSIAQVEYKLGEETHFVITSACTPVSDYQTRMFAVAQFKSRIPVAAVRRVLEPIAMRIFRQDARILQLQTENIRRFGGEQYTHTELDLMGPQIWRLMRQAERGASAETDEDGARSFSVELEA